MEKLTLTKELFFETLPKLKKYKPVITRTGFIRFGKRNKGYQMCPLTALRKELTGIAGDIYKIADYFTNEKFCIKIAQAADNSSDYSWTRKLRKKILKGLNLKEGEQNGM